jgi:hypothetical protein
MRQWSDEHLTKTVSAATKCARVLGPGHVLNINNKEIIHLYTPQVADTVRPLSAVIADRNDDGSKNGLSSSVTW